MRGWTGIVLAGVVAALAGVIWLATVLVGQARARVVEEFAAQEQVHVSDSARTIETELNDVLEDLHFAAGWVRQGRPDEVKSRLRALLDIGHPYQAVVVVDGSGDSVLSILDDQLGPSRELDPLTAAAREALSREPGEVALVPPEERSGWSRAFTVPFATASGRGALALLVDTESFFRALPGERGLHVIVLDGHGRPLPATTPGLRKALAAPTPAMAELVASMRRGDDRRLRWSADEARAVIPGLGEAVVTIVPLKVHGAASWSMAVVTPVGMIGQHERALTLRIALTAAAIASCLLALGAYLIVGARRGAALQLRLAHAQRLAHLHEKTEKIVDNIPAAVLVLSDVGEITGLNRAFRDRLDGADLLGQPWPHAFAQATPVALERLRALIDGAGASRTVTSLPGATLSLFGVDGRYSVHAVPLEPRFAEARMLLVIEDLSELRALEDQLLRAEKLATVGVLAAGIAHEIGTPLGVVRGRAEYMRGKLGQDGPASGGLNVIIEQIDLISRTIRQLLDFSRARQAVVRAVRLEPIARAVVDLLRFEAERRKVTLAVEVAPGLPPLHADADALQQMLVNLTMNALDASRPGGHVTIAGAVDGKTRARIEVRDDGAGIPPEQRNQIFDPFFTTKKRGQGTGLGLTLCAQVVRDHGGQIEVDSEVGRGTTVIVTWPRAPEDGHGAIEANHPGR